MGEIPKIPVVQKPKVPTDPANPEYIFDVQDHAHDEEHELKQESKESVKVMGSRGPGGAAQEEEEGVDEAQRNMRKKEARKGLFALNAREKTDKLLTADDVFQSITSKESARGEKPIHQQNKPNNKPNKTNNKPKQPHQTDFLPQLPTSRAIR